MTTQEQPKHHIYGPSSLKYREICPGWKNDNDQDFTKADEGTMLHLAAETGNLAGLDPEQVTAVKCCLDYIAPLEAGALEVHKEAKLVIEGGLTYGTADRVIIRRAGRVVQGHVVDFKFGRRTVDDASENRQGMAYLLGVFAQWPEVDSVTVHFLLPRLDEVLKHTFFRKDVPRIRLIVRTIIARCAAFDKTKDPSLLNPTDYGCTYCGRKSEFKSGTMSVCPALAKYALTIAQKYDPLVVPIEVHSSQITDPQRMADLYIAVKVLEKLVDSAKKHVVQFARDNPLPGFSMRERKGTTKITNSTLAYGVLKENFTPDELAACCDFSYTELLKLVSEKAPKGQKSEAARQLYTALSDAECISSGEPTTYLQRDRAE